MILIEYSPGYHPPWINIWIQNYLMIQLLSIQLKIDTCIHGKNILIVKYMNLCYRLRFQSILHSWIVMPDLEMYSNIHKVDKHVVYIARTGNIDLIIH